ncbi:hypothetical protein [Neorhizobium sp. NCHU2750]|uniref:hypothetical protein n=1 Tax=Neorhizobium sp. NCHU2750 TaxID=1825976 RepID=UPI000E708601|nr:phosphoribosyltransferase [Neorhizobium sp. NCHU2750]
MQPGWDPAHYTNHDEASLMLAEEVAALSLGDVVVVALSPAQVALAFEATRRLGCELDLLLVGRIFAPGHPEQPVGSIIDLDRPQLSVDEALARNFHLPPGYLNSERQRQTAELARQHFMYLGDDDEAGTHRHAGKDVVILDDGMEGAILQRIIRHMGDAGARTVRVVAIPSAAGEATDDRAVAQMLKEARRLHRLLH